MTKSDKAKVFVASAFLVLAAGELFGFLARPVYAAFWQWSRTAANNGTADPSINWAEGMAPSSINDSARAQMAREAEQRDDQSGLLVTGGTASAYTVTTNQGMCLSPSVTPQDGQTLTATMNATNNASATLGVDSCTVYPIQSPAGTAAPAGTLISGVPYSFKFSNANSSWVVRFTALTSSLPPPTTQKFTSGTNATYTTPANTKWIEIKLLGPGGGGSGSSGTGGSGGNGSGSSSASTCWGASGTACVTPVYASGAGQGGTANFGNGGAGGTVSGSGTCIEAVSGADGQGGTNNVSTSNSGAAGASSVYGGAGAGKINAGGGSAKANTGSGGASGSSNTQSIGGSGGAGAYCYVIILNPAASYVFTVGTGGSGGTAGAGNIGGTGADGRVTVIEHYGS